MTTLIEDKLLTEAEGILMERHKISAERAFLVLTRVHNARRNPGGRLRKHRS